MSPNRVPTVSQQCPNSIVGQNGPIYDDWPREKLINEIKRLKKYKKYGLVWDEKNTEEEIFYDGRLPVLRESKRIPSQNKQNNILIEGDNIHALSVLNYTHRKKIDAIYIDPPYNTGNNTWKYNNKYVDKTDGYIHSKWISFMTKRLKLAKPLLKDDGIICVTIDNHELHNLCHIMNDVFPDREIIVTVIEHNIRGRTKNNFALTHEYALWAVKKGHDLITKLPDLGDDIRRNLRRTGNNSKRSDSPTMFYGIMVDKKTLKILSATEPLDLKKKIPKHIDKNVDIIWPIDGEGNERNWYYSPEKMLSEAENGECYAKKINNAIQVHYHIPGKPKRRKSVWSDSKYDASTYGSELLTEIIGENDFPFPKSIHAVKDCILAMTSKKDALVLDFFAGSGTTGHAVLELNKDDKGSRRFILCTNNEGNICREITYPRLFNVIKGYKFKGKQRNCIFHKKINYTAIKNAEKLVKNIEQIKFENKNDYDDFEIKIKNNTVQLIGIKAIDTKKTGLGSGLVCYEIDQVEKEPGSAKYDPPSITDANRRRVIREIRDVLCVKEWCFDHICQDRSPVQSFIICGNKDGKYMGIVYDPQGTLEFSKIINKMEEIKSIHTYVFSEIVSSTLRNNQKVKFQSIPTEILAIWNRIFMSNTRRAVK